MPIKTNIFTQGVNEIKQQSEKLKQSGQLFKDTVDNSKKILDEMELKSKSTNLRNNMKKFYDEAGDEYGKNTEGFNEKVKKYKELMLDSSSNSLIKNQLNEELEEQNRVYQSNLSKINKKREDKKEQEIDYNYIKSSNQLIEQYVNEGDITSAEKTINKINETLEKDYYSLDYKASQKKQTNQIFLNSVVKNTANSTIDYLQKVLNKEVEATEPLKMLLDEAVGYEKVNEIFNKKVHNPEDLELITYEIIKKLDNPTEENNKFFNIFGLNVEKGVVFSNNKRIEEEQLNIIKEKFKETVNDNLIDFKENHLDNIKKAKEDVNTIFKVISEGGYIEEDKLLMLTNKHEKYLDEKDLNRIGVIGKLQNQNNFSFEEREKEGFYDERYDDEKTKIIAKSLNNSFTTNLHKDSVGTLFKNSNNNIKKLDNTTTESYINSLLTRDKTVNKLQDKYNTDAKLLSSIENKNLIKKFNSFNHKEKFDFIQKANGKNPKIYKKLMKEVFEKEGMNYSMINSTSIIEQKGDYDTVNKILTGEEILKNNEKIWNKQTENDLSMLIKQNLSGIYGVNGSLELAYKKDAIKNHIITSLTQNGVTDITDVNIEAYYELAQDKIIGKVIQKNGVDNDGNEQLYNVVLPNLSMTEEDFNKNIASLSVESLNVIKKPYINPERIIKGIQDKTLRLVKTNIEDNPDNVYNVYLGNNPLAAEDGSVFVMPLSNTEDNKIFPDYNQIADYFTENGVDYNETKEKKEVIKMSFDKKIEDMSKILSTIDLEIKKHENNFNRKMVNQLKTLRFNKLKDIENMKKRQKKSRRSLNSINVDFGNVN